MDGTLTGFLKVGEDVTARRATEAALQEFEARFRQFGAASADVLWIRDRKSLAFKYVSPFFEAVYGPGSRTFSAATRSAAGSK